MPTSWLARRWKRWTAIFLSLIMAALVASHWIIGPILLRQIQALAEQRLHARFTAANLWYVPPYTLVAYDCHLSDSRNPAAGDLIDVSKIRVTLDQFPRGSAPLRLRGIEIRRPTIHIIRTADGIAGFERLLPSGTATTEPEEIVSTGRRKISDVVQVGRLSIEDCEFDFVDGAKRTWIGPTINLDATGQSAANYSFGFSIQGSTPIEIHASGSLNIDNRFISLDAFQIVADIGYSNSSPLPPRITEFLRQNRIQGLLRLQGQGKFMGRKLSRSSASAQMLFLNSWGLRSDGEIHLSDGALVCDVTKGSYGNDQFSAVAHLPTSSWQNGIINCADIDASIDFHPPSPIYPDPLDVIFAQVRPGGVYHVKGSATQDFHARDLQYDLHITSEDGSALITRRSVALAQVKLDSELFPDHLLIAHLDCQGLGGSLSGQGTVASRRPYSFGGNISAEGADLHQIATLLSASESEKEKLQGKVKANGTFGGAGPHDGKSAADLFVADGHFEIEQGNLWDIPTLQRITSRVSIARRALTVGDASGDFHVADQRVNLTDAQISAPIMGMQGSGTVGFDGQLNLEVVAAVLADWQDKIDKSGVPIVSGVAGGIAGKLESLVNKTTSNLLYKFHVTGSASDPKVAIMPAPAITQDAGRLFGDILKPITQPASQPTAEITTQP